MAIAFVVPCYNEAKRTNFEVFKSYESGNSDVKFFFVNDGSTDGTQEVLEKHFKADQVINLPENSGKAEAVRLGMVKVCVDESFTHVGFLDADLATPLSEISEFKNYASMGKKVILGSRILRLGGDIRRKWYRHYLGRLFATVASSLLKLPVYDTQCGAKLFSRIEIKKVLEGTFISKWIFDVELLFRLQKLGTLSLSDFYEIPLSSWEDVGGSRLKVTDFLKAPLELLQLYRRYH